MFNLIDKNIMNKCSGFFLILPASVVNWRKTYMVFSYLWIDSKFIFKDLCEIYLIRFALNPHLLDINYGLNV